MRPGLGKPVLSAHLRCITRYAIECAVHLLWYHSYSYARYIVVTYVAKLAIYH